MKTVCYKLLALFLALIMSGCLALPSPEEKAAEARVKLGDEIYYAFEPFFLKHPYAYNIYSDALRLELKDIIDYEHQIPQSRLYAAMSRRAINNEVFALYKEMVAKNNGVLKTYSPNINVLAYKIMIGNVPDKRQDDQLFLLDTLPVLAEYDVNGELKSILLNEARVNVALNQFHHFDYAPTRVNLRLKLLSGEQLNLIKFNISKDTFSKNEI